MRVPFRGLRTKEYHNLALAAVAGMQVATLLYSWSYFSIETGLSIDFMVFWGAGYVANSAGYSEVYNPELLSKIQASFIPVMKRLVVPHLFFYPPLFVLPFRLFALLPPMLSFRLWFFMNLFILIWYLRFFASRLASWSGNKKFLVMLLLSYPVFNNLFLGQVDVWLVICVGEFMLALLRGKPWKAGVWLAGLIMKPQLLILILPAMSLGRELRVLGGFAFASLILFIISTILAGPEGMKRLFSLWLGAAGGAFEPGRECMANWQMLGFHFSSLISPVVGKFVEWLGIVSTAALALYLWVRVPPRKERAFASVLLGTIIATLSITWRSYYHLWMLLLPPFMCLAESLPQILFDIWVFAPYGLVFLIIFVGALAKVTGLTLPASYGCPIMASSFLIINFTLLLWAVKQKMAIDRMGQSPH